MDFETVYQELASGAEILRVLLTGVTQAEAQTRPSTESWSILEVVCHLADEERNDFRPRLDVMLHRPTEDFPPNDPQQWMTERKYNERDLEDSLSDFLQERNQSLRWLRKLDAPNWDAVYTTPFRTMTAGDMMASWVAHDILHMRQLVELRWARMLRLTAPHDVEYAGGW